MKNLKAEITFMNGAKIVLNGNTENMETIRGMYEPEYLEGVEPTIEVGEFRDSNDDLIGADFDGKYIKTIKFSNEVL